MGLNPAQPQVRLRETPAARSRRGPLLARVSAVVCLAAEEAVEVLFLLDLTMDRMAAFSSSEYAPFPAILRTLIERRVGSRDRFGRTAWQTDRSEIEQALDLRVRNDAYPSMST